MRSAVITRIIAVGLGTIANVAQADEPSVIVKGDGSISVHCRIAAGKDAATFRRLFGENATVHGNCNDQEPETAWVAAGTGNGTNPDPVPRGGGGGVAPVCVCPESMIEKLSERLRQFEPVGGLLPEKLTWQDPESWIDQATFAAFDTVAELPNRTEDLGSVEDFSTGGSELVLPFHLRISDAWLRTWSEAPTGGATITSETDNYSLDWVEQNGTSERRRNTPWMDQNSENFDGFNAPSLGQ